MGTISVEKIQAAFEDIRKDNKKSSEPDAPAVADLSPRELQIIQARCSTHMQDHAPVHDIICDVIECRPNLDEVKAFIANMDEYAQRNLAEEVLKNQGLISGWCIDDVIYIAREQKLNPTKAQALEILQMAVDNQDANDGINWEVLRYWVSEYKSENKMERYSKKKHGENELLQ